MQIRCVKKEIEIYKDVFLEKEIEIFEDACFTDVCFEMCGWLF